ncbi:predicted protein [Pyrenophora tritici-repentis Pt-1C-BFP]|uniref:Uncharacterized protein n=1 Tax=Pyrenophora tritici-repentis (strain Pt-1C-BFP) TaxID=426418 RepID=B2W4T5_PYRTR|nr:uncharacterized protein PTRG_04635 [Pyrenophora tritici-repentis Pt-1C-BFP]EDU47542.1 predicted protein [Pyrenophora tritici-repentis Pt-1C-BFP]
MAYTTPPITLFNLLSTPSTNPIKSYTSLPIFATVLATSPTNSADDTLRSVASVKVKDTKPMIVETMESGEKAVWISHLRVSVAFEGCPMSVGVEKIGSFTWVYCGKAGNL